jgi:hypothetical protein
MTVRLVACGVRECRQAVTDLKRYRERETKRRREITEKKEGMQLEQNTYVLVVFLSFNALFTSDLSWSAYSSLVGVDVDVDVDGGESIVTSVLATCTTPSPSSAMSQWPLLLPSPPPLVVGRKEEEEWEGDIEE